jgi:hypothetical protein
MSEMLNPDTDQMKETHNTIAEKLKKQEYETIFSI